jgi:hypothetical protein
MAGVWHEDMTRSIGPDTIEVLDYPFMVRIEYPTDAFLSSNTFPTPSGYYTTNQNQLVRFDLNFTSGYAQTIICSFIYPTRQRDIQSKIFWSGILIGVGVPLVIQGLRDF